MAERICTHSVPMEEIEGYRDRLYRQYDAHYTRLCETWAQEIPKRWNRDYTSPEAYEASVAANRKRWIEMLGGWPWARCDLQPRREKLDENEHFTTERVWLKVLEYEGGSVEIDALLLTPQDITSPRPVILAQHGLGCSPEIVCGFLEREGEYHRFGARLARRGYVVIAPRMVVFHEKRRPLYRKARLMGENLIGAEMFSLSRVLDFVLDLDEVDPKRVGMYGLSQGGMSSLFFPASDPRVKATVISAYFNLRAHKMVRSGGENYTAYIDSPEEDKFLQGQLLEFSDADIASLICPRAVMVECGTQDGAVYWPMCYVEWMRLKEHYDRLGIPERCRFELNEGGHEIFYHQAPAFLDEQLEFIPSDDDPPATYFFVPEETVDVLRERLWNHYNGYYTRRCEQSPREVASRWHYDFSSLEAYERSVAPNRERWFAFLGGWPWPRGPLRPRVEPVFEADGLICDRVWLTSIPGVEFDSLLLRPADLTEPTPAILAQHGLGSSPEHVIGCLADSGAYHSFGYRLAQLGYVVLAPRMVTFREKRQRLHRKAMLMGQQLMGAEMFALSRAVDYLETLDFVDADRIGMYGLSQGGQSALWLPACDPRIQVSVCSAFFNLRWKKMVVSDGVNYVAYLDTEEEDKFYRGQLLEFSDPEIVSLICPRAFFVEAGKQDQAAYWQFQVEEFERVKELYTRLGIPDRCGIEVFDGGHEIHFVGAVEFLDRHLRGG